MPDSLLGVSHGCRAPFARAGNRDAVGVDREMRLLLQRAREVDERLFRDFRDRTAHSAHDMAVPVIGSVIHDRLAVQRQRRRLLAAMDKLRCVVLSGEGKGFCAGNLSPNGGRWPGALPHQHVQKASDR